MKIIAIKESGCSNILNYAISHGADIFGDLDIQSIINDETFYLITIEDVNFLELLRLTQMYREKLRIIKEEKADVPPRSSLAKLFKGNITVNKDTKDEKSISMAEGVEFVCQNFINLILQMKTDDDIISSYALRLFLPMITRKFTIQIPFGFIDLCKSMSNDEGKEIFTKEYPNTLASIIENPDHRFHKIFNLGFIKSTEIIRYNQQYDKYLNVFKFQSLKPTKENINKLYKVGMLGFHCFNNLSRGETRCSLFATNKESLDKSLAEFKDSNTPIYFDFAIELPIQYMQILCNAFSREVLTISFESSMATIINGGLDFNGFIIPEHKGDDEPTEEEQTEINNKLNEIEAYRVRIAEANQYLMNTLQAILMDETADIDITSTFAMIPCIYKAKAVLTINSLTINQLAEHNNDIISAMFKEISDMISSVLNDIQ